MADYIYTMEIRFTPDQQKGAAIVQEIARAARMNLYLTGGTIRDVISGFPIRDLDFTVQGNPFKLQKELERAGAAIAGSDEETKTLYVQLPGHVRAEIAMARIERYEKTGKPPIIAPATIIEDLRRRDFTINAMALSLNAGSRGLLMDPFNGAADLESKVIRVLHNYAFLEEPSRLIRATRFAARFHWPLEERTQARYDAAKENNYIEYILPRYIGHEIEQLAYEDDPLHVIRALEKEGWLKLLSEHWTTAKVDANGLTALMKTRQQMNELGYQPDPAAAVMYFLTSKLSDKEIADMRRAIPRKTLVDSWKDLEEHAKDLTKKLSGKESATPARTWQLLSNARPEMILFLAVTARQQGVLLKIKNFFTKWRQVQQKIPLPEMTELHITPQMPEYPKIAHDVFLLLLDGKLRSRTETLKYLKPLAPPPPPPPPPPPAKRGRAAKAAAAAAAQGPPTAVPAAAGKKKGKAGQAPVPAPPTAAVSAANVKGKGAPAKPMPAGKAAAPSQAAPKLPGKATPAKPANAKNHAAAPAKPAKAATNAKPSPKKAAAKKKH
jgi:tRNA nucleotidyltransferase (CCA-adding enzyme)